MNAQRVFVALGVLATACSGVLIVLDLTVGGIVMAGVAGLLFAAASNVPPKDLA